tara:strand:+ start:244 stop:504 length:261 start_codon:yes stop_codon:yes gene_type:complete
MIAVPELLEDFKRSSLMHDKLDKVNYIQDLKENPLNQSYGLYMIEGLMGLYCYDVRIWNPSLERWMFLESFDNVFEAELELRKANG